MKMFLKAEAYFFSVCSSLVMYMEVKWEGRLKSKANLLAVMLCIYAIGFSEPEAHSMSIMFSRSYIGCQE